MTLYALTSFLSAFLLFQIQPMIGKYILPWFGSSPSVWATALLFFQVHLLVGYAYAHFTTRLFSSRGQACIHSLLLLGALLFLPIAPAEVWKPEPESDPTWRILALLTATVGVPYVFLASTAPLLQAWFARTHADRSPYRLYAVSNAGSLLALLSYPFVVEPRLTLQIQTWSWSGGFIVFALLTCACAFLVYRFAWTNQAAASDNSTTEVGQQFAHAEKGVGVDTEHPRLSSIVLWLSLSALGSVMLLATLNRMSMDVPAVPFMFVLPLSLYLLTFIIAFDSPRWYYRPLFCVLLLVGTTAALTALLERLGLTATIVFYSAALFTCCMSCHGELVRLKPSPRHLTLFYLMVAVGGALGGVFVALVAPLVFDGLWEYEIGLVASWALVMGLVSVELGKKFRSARTQLGEQRPMRQEVTRQSPPTKARKRKKGKAGKLQRESQQEVGQREQLRRSLRRLNWLRWSTVSVTGTWLLGLIWLLAANVQDDLANAFAHSRNFYGVLRVDETNFNDPTLHTIELYHGSIRHGFQYRYADRASTPTLYYGRKSGIGLAITHHPQRNARDRQFRIGVVGLGVGTLSAYANDAQTALPQGVRTNDYLRYYEINPQVVALADEYFSFTKDAKSRGADIEIFLGDARIVMEQQLERGEAQRFDVLAVDAFSSDAVPMHLLTKECFGIYLDHLRPDGILAVHISNRFLNLLPVVRASAAAHGMPAYFVYYPGDRYGNSTCRWVLVTKNGEFLENEAIQKATSRTEDDEAVLWTDDFSSLFQVLDD